ncbi:MAG: outer membrane protein assembly factor BamD [Deltaproteobacteria bacterium]|nr:outer membrane protein assembly factor BamD [Deltaproteobacteria bacterium]
MARATAIGPDSSIIRTGLALVGAWALVTGLSGCASTPTEAEEVPPAEALYQRGLTQMDAGKILWVFPSGDEAEAIETFQQIIDNYPYSEHAVSAELKIADAYYAQGKYDEALSYYRDFSELHPQHASVPYALSHAALCHYQQSKSPDRDQTATTEAIKYLDQLIARHPHSAEAREGEQMWKELRTKLAQHDMQIADFYMDRDEFQSAADRYRGVLNEYPGLGLDAEALYKLGVCYTEMNLEDEAHKIFEVILQNYRGTDVAAAAADRMPEGEAPADQIPSAN